MKKTVFFAGFCILLASILSAGEVSLASGGRFDITSRTSFGVCVDEPWRYGLKQELTNFRLTLNLLPYQQLTSRVNSPDAVGFIDLTFFNLDMEFNPKIKPNSGSGGYNAPDEVMTNRFQTGSFIAGIASGKWVLQMNAGGNEPFWSPWNKSIGYVNDNIKFSWASLDSMVDVTRTKKVSELLPQDPVVQQYQQDVAGVTDTFGLNLGGAMIGAMYNEEGRYGFNLKAATQYPYDSATVTEDNANGLAAGTDFVLTPTGDRGLKVTGSAGGSYQYGDDDDPDPVMAGAKAGYVIALNDDLSLEPFAGADIGTAIKKSGTPGALEYEVSGGVAMRWPGQGGWYTDYILDAEGRVFPGMSASYKMHGDSETEFGDNRHDVKFTLFEPRGDEGVFYGIGSEIIVDIGDIASSTRTFMATVYADYAISGFMDGPGTLVPWGTVCFDNVPGTESGRVSGIKFDGGFKLRNAITNTVLGLTWDSGDILHDNTPYRFGYTKVSVEIQY